MIRPNIGVGHKLCGAERLRALTQLLPAWLCLLSVSGAQHSPPGLAPAPAPPISRCELQSPPGLDIGNYSAIDAAPRQFQVWLLVSCTGQQTWTLSLTAPSTPAGQSVLPGTLGSALSGPHGDELVFQAQLTPATGGGGPGPAQVSLNLIFPPGQFAAASGVYSGAITITLAY